MAAKALDSKSGMAERKEKRISSFRELFFDDFKSSKALKGLVSACKWPEAGRGLHGLQHAACGMIQLM
jgi:hypothetical protein